MRFNSQLSQSNNGVPHLRGAFLHPPVEFPADLREWQSEPALSRTVAEVVEREGIADTTDEVSLGIIVYSYATGSYESREIEQALSETVAGGTVPDLRAWNIRRYRRNHRSQVEQCLAEVLRRAFASVSDTLPIPTCTDEDFRREAGARVDWAVRRDCWSMDL